MSKRSCEEILNQSKRGCNEETAGLPDPREDFFDQECESEPEIDESSFEGVLPETDNSVDLLRKGHEKNGVGVESNVLGETTRYYNTFNTSEYRSTIKVKFNLTNFNGDIQTIATQLDNLYKQLVEPVTSKFTENDWYSVAIKNKSFKDKPFFIKPKQIKYFKENTSEFTDAATRVSQSNSDFIFNVMEFLIYVTQHPSGKGIHTSSRRKKAPIDQSQNSKKRRCVISIKNKDNSCGYRAIYVGVSWDPRKLSNENIDLSNMRSEWRKITADNADGFQKKGTIDMINSANSFLHNQKCGSNCSSDCESAKRFNYDIPFGSNPNDFEHMNDYLGSINMNFVIMDAGDTANPVYEGLPEDQNCRTIYIEWVKGTKETSSHFNFIKDIEKYTKTEYFCRCCHRGHWSINHRCDGVCSVCGQYPKCKESNPIDCEVCGITFVNEKCHSNHLDNKSCKNRKRCSNCLCFYRDDKKTKHVCGEYKCRDCNKNYTEPPHYCMLKPLDIDKLIKEDEVNKLIVTFDIESTIKSAPGDENDSHVPSLLISETVCDKCWNGMEKATLDCSICGVGAHMFRGFGCVREFTDYLYMDLAKKAELNKLRIIVFAHNSKGYDSHFIMQDMFERRFADQPQIIMQGLKVLKIGVNNVDFIDSLSFFQQPLSALPKSFGFEDKVMKGFFPHMFNREENWSYIGPIPAIEHFATDFMKDSAAEECKKWHSNYEGLYNFNEELEEYCKSDVKILTRAVMKFRELFKSVTKLDPITRNFTLASVAMEHFRSSVLKEDQLGITPIKGYVNNRNSSLKANIWLDYKQTQSVNKIYREYKIGPYYCDGYVKEDRIIYEFFGCFFHGCDSPNCNKDKNRTTNMSVLNNKSLDNVLQETKERIKYFRDKGYRFICIWEHEYDILCIKDKALKEFYKHRMPYYKRIDEYGHLNIRDAFFGGRTNNLFFNENCKEGEVIKYLDVTSLYPSVLVKNPYPIGHPTVLSDFKNNEISEYFGFIKCKIMAPQDLYIPVLPYRDSKKKLVFPLCSTCAEEKLEKCSPKHDRAFVGTWFSEEIKLALTKGYKIIQIYEVLHYEQKSENLFKPYIQSWLKVKTESSGWPSSCKTEELKQNFIEEFKQREGVALDYEQMEKNPGKRFISKLMLNSLWGKLGQRRNQGQTTICTNYSQFFKLISDAKNEIKGIVPINDEIMLVNHSFTDEAYDKAGNTNIAVAAMVTGYARIKLYSIIDQIEASYSPRVLYFDTDSVIFKDRPGSGWDVPEIGDFLGDMTDEVAKDYGPDAYIDSFASGGPKNYAYTVKTEKGVKFVTKIKGLNITHGLKEILNFDCVNTHAEEYRKGNKDIHKLVKQLQFKTNQYHEVTTSIFDKKYRAVSDKRIVCSKGQYQTLPYGFLNN